MYIKDHVLPRFSFWNADVDLLFNLSSRALDASNIFFLRNSRRKASDCRAEFASAVPESLLSIIINTKITCNLTIWVWPYCCKIPCPCQGNADKPIGNEPLLVNFKPSRYLSKTYALNIKTFSYGKTNQCELKTWKWELTLKDLVIYSELLY